MAVKHIFERYNNIYQFMQTIESRPNNGRFGESSHKETDEEWSGTKTYAEAVEQFSNGLPERCEKMRKSMERFKAASNVNTAKARPKNHYYGYAPNVPAAIIGLPKSMRYTERIPQKVKAISLVFDCCVSCMVSPEEMIKAGCTILEAVYALEASGYRVKLDLSLYSTESDGQKIACLITLKEWQNHLDLLKLSFPLTSPSMFRRFGLKWAEGIEGVTSRHVYGYGHIMSDDKVKSLLRENGYNIDSTYFVRVRTCKDCGFDALQLVERLGIKKG